MTTPASVRPSVTLALTSSLLVIAAFSPRPAVAADAAAEKKQPYGLTVATSTKESADSRRAVRATAISHAANEEFQASAPDLAPEAREQALKMAATHRGAERNVRADGATLLREHRLLKPWGVADQSDDVAQLEISAYTLTGSLRKQLEFFPELNAPATPKDSGLVTRIRFGRDLAAEAAKLPAEGRREKLRAWITARVAKFPDDVTAGTQQTLRESFDTQFKILSEVFGDAIAGLEAAELLVRLDGYTADSQAKLAEMLARNGRRDAALASLDAALALDPKNERALKWEKTLAGTAPELFSGVVEEPADPATLAAAPVWALAGIPPKPRERIAVESAARTMGHRILSALRVPADRREAAVKQAVELHRGLVGVLTEPTRTTLSEAQKAVLAASSAKNTEQAHEAFAKVPPETATHVLFWQLRAVRFMLEESPRDVLDCIYVVQAMEPENAWAKNNRQGYERRASAPPKPKPVAREEHSKTYDELDQQLRWGFFSLVQSQTEGMLAVNPANAEALILRARLKLAQGDRPGATTDLRAAVAAGGPLLAEAHGRLAQALVGPAAQAAESASEMAEAFKLSPDQPDALFVQAVSDLRAKKYPEALAAIERAIAIRPEFEEAIGFRASVLQQSGKSAEAEKSLRDALATRKQSVFLRAALVLRLITDKKFDEARVLIAEISKMKQHGSTERTVSMLKGAIERAEKAANPGGPGTAPVPPGAAPASSATPPPAEGPKRRPGGDR